MGFVTAVRSALDKIMPGRQPGGSMHGMYVPTDAGVMVTEDSAMRLAAVQACVRVLSEDVAALPIRTGPGTGFGVVKTVKKGALLTPVAADCWVPVLVNGEVRWISGKYTEVL